MNRKLYKHEDNAFGRLNAGISAGTLTIPLQSGQGALLPVTANGAATSLGTSTALNDTGIQAALTAGGFGVGDIIENVTDGSYAIIKSVATNAIVTTRLKGGSDNTWQSSDVWAVNRFIVTLIKYDVDGETVLQREKVLIESRSGDNLTVNASGRGFDGSTAASFATGDHCYLFMTSAAMDGAQQAIAQAFSDIDDLETATSGVAYTGVSNVWTAPQSLTADLLQITSDPDSANDPVRKSYFDDIVDPILTGLGAYSFGDGSDGNVTLDGSATYASFLSKSGATYTALRDLFLGDMAFSGGAILDMAGFQLYSNGTASGTGTIRNNGLPGANGNVPGSGTYNGDGAAYGGDAGASAPGITVPKPGASGNGGRGAYQGHSAGTPGTSVGIAPATTAGSAGGAGANGGAGGAGGTVTTLAKWKPGSAIRATEWFHFAGATLAVLEVTPGSGGGGGGGSPGGSGTPHGSGGGGAGGAGGYLFAAIRHITGTITFEAKGGAGGNGGATSNGTVPKGGGGGAGGNGGRIFIMYATSSGYTTDVTGGAGGAGGIATGGTNGTAGAAGSSGGVSSLVVA